jgi:hypothetical protein
MSEVPAEPPETVLDPMERISELLFGTIMALTFTCALGIATADTITIRAMLIGALGCNLAWGIIDGGVYLLTNVNNQARKLLTLRSMREAPDLATAQRIIADALPPLLVPIVSTEQLELMRQRLHQLPEQPQRPHLTKGAWIGALGICAISFLSAFPIAIPFIFMSDVRSALRVSNVIATVMLFACGYAFGLRGGLRPWATGLSMVVIGGAFVGVAIALGG